ncbi:MAG: alpha/beta hydrolase [Bacteroidetes bacterium]|nr:MAG: alpha/beta hydrolase [Bacteroidota bacterium]
MHHIKHFTIFTSLFLFAHISMAQLPHVSSGTFVRIDSFRSKYVTPRHIDIWLPKGFSRKKKYAVLYMHDGQMLYDSSTTWNKAAWDVDDAAATLMKAGTIMDVIVVGVWNGGSTRHPDYFPQKPYESLSPMEKDTVTAQLQRAGRTTQVFKPVSDNYLRFLVEELKPLIDKSYPTLPDRPHTFVAGSSMGGLISMYAICEYPNVFGGAACISTHWPGLWSLDNNPVPQAFLAYLKQNLPDPESHKLYFDYGDQTLDALYPALQRQVDEVMRSKGFSSNNWITKYFPGQDHSELAWNRRLHVPLTFLLAPAKH